MKNSIVIKTCIWLLLIFANTVGAMQQKFQPTIVPLLEATKKGDLDKVSFLVLKAKASIDQADILGNTALHYAAVKGFLDIVIFLVEHHASLNKANNDGDTPLHFAVLLEHIPVIQYLAQQIFTQSASIDLSNNDGETPLFLAAHEGRLRIIQMLIFYGADPTLQSREGKTPIDVALTNKTRAVLLQALHKNKDHSTQT
jgi:ankyrin repeat protein